MKNKKNSDIIGWILRYIILPAAFITVVVYEQFYAPSPAETTLKESGPIQFHGRVDSIYFDKRNHNVEYAVLSIGYRYPIYPGWINEIKVGDSLSKQKGDFRVERYRKGEPSKILDYRILVKEFNK